MTPAGVISKVPFRFWGRSFTQIGPAHLVVLQQRARIALHDEETGRIVMQGEAHALLEDDQVRRAYLGE